MTDKMANTDKQIIEHRNAIDALDAHILTLLNQRADHARAIGELKGSGIIYRPEREAQVLARIRQLNTGPLSDESVSKLFREIMSACLSLERPLTIAYLGPEGTFSQSAAYKHFGHAAVTQGCASIDDAFRTVEARTADYVVAPVENSTEGAVGRTLDLMVNSPLRVCGEVVLPIHHHLLRLPSQLSGQDSVSQAMNLHGVQRLYSHAQSLAQCHEWINKHIPVSIERVPVVSNAEAARLASLDGHCVAIAGEAAAERYQLARLASNIEDDPNNSTRFLVLGYHETAPSGRDKTSLVMSAQNRSGAVHHLLAPLAEQGVSMTKFESRPSRHSFAGGRSGLWEYLFFVDVEGHAEEPRIKKMLAALHTHATFVKVLGAYPVAEL